MIKRPKRSIKPPQNLKEFVVVADLDDEKTTDLKNEKLNTQESKSIFKCKKCSIICKSKSEIFSHLKRHKGKENYICEECGKTLSSLQAFLEHSNIHKNIKPYRCDVCGHESRQISVHSRHLLTHEDNPEKIFRCTVCSKAFKQKDYLKQHIRKHVGEKPYECSQCTKKFSAKSELNRHSISHGSTRPFSCQFCNKKFKLKHNLAAHVRAHTRSRVWKCCLCKASFPQLYLMEKHKKTHTEVVQHLELIKTDPRSLSITTRPLDRRKVLHHQKMTLPSKLDLNDSQNPFNSKMSLGLSDAYIPISVLANSFGTGNYIRLKIVDTNLTGRNVQLSTGVADAVLVEDEVALEEEERKRAMTSVVESNSAEEDTESEKENQMDFNEKFHTHFETFEDIFKNDALEEAVIVWLQAMVDIVKDVGFPLNDLVFHQLHTVIVKIQTLIVNSIKEVKQEGYSLVLHAPSCKSCITCDADSTEERNKDKEEREWSKHTEDEEEINKEEKVNERKNTEEIYRAKDEEIEIQNIGEEEKERKVIELKNDNLKKNKKKLKVEFCNSEKNENENQREKLKKIFKCFSSLNDCLHRHLSIVLEL